jgi:hypothetical protein
VVATLAVFCVLLVAVVAWRSRRAQSSAPQKPLCPAWASGLLHWPVLLLLFDVLSDLYAYLTVSALLLKIWRHRQ